MTKASSARREVPFAKVGYPSYVDSGVEWIGMVPEGWQVCRARFVARLETGHTPSRNRPDYWENCTVPWFTLADVWQLRDGTRKYLGETKEKVSEIGLANSAARKLPQGTVIVSRTASVGFSGIMPCEMATSQDFVNWVPGSRMNSEYLLYVFRSMAQEFCRLTMGSTHKTIYWPDVQDFSTPVPSFPEQRAIAAFIDRETAKIDRLIEKKKRLIKALEERRAALISHVVTKGLDPNVPMKDSGVDWLGEIPANWVQTKFRYIGDLVGGSTPDKGNAEYWSGSIPWVSPKDMKTRTIGESIDHVSESAVRVTSLKLILPPAVLFVVRGMILAHSFPVAVTTEPLTINQDMKALHPKEGFSPEFAAFLFDGIRDVVLSYVEESSHGTKCLRTDEWNRIMVFLPPEDEQLEIVQRLTEVNKQFDGLVARIREAVDKFNEYRTALISAAVTGKIDVRGEVA